VSEAKNSLVRGLRRGLLRQCAHCGGKGAFFTGWYSTQDRCKTCGVKWQRNAEGFQLGAAAINIILTGGSLLAVMAIGVIVTYPEVPTWPLIAIVGSVALLVGIGGYPMSYTMWFAIDLFMNHLSDEELADAAAHAADGRRSPN
jgi:uncharacterized protein (DUF983 family)